MKSWIDVPQKDILRIAILLRNLGTKVGKNIEFSFQRVGLVQVVAILTLPAKGSPLHIFQARQIDISRFEKFDVLATKILTYTGHQIHPGEEAGHHTKEGRRASQDFFRFPKGRLDRVVCYRAHRKY